MADLHVFANDCEWYVAADLDDALAAQREFTGFTEDDQERDEWDQLDDESSLNVHMEIDGEDELVTKTCREWAAEKGRGFLCTTEF